jgi:outer membrane protein
MKKIVFIVAILAIALQTRGFSKDNVVVAVVNFSTCLQDSKFGKKEQENFENLRKQMVSMIEESQKELQDLSAKMEDPDYLDGLSPKAEEELKTKFQTKNQDLGRLQNQYYQVLQQANMQVMQKLNTSVSKASQVVAQKKKLDIIMNKEVCFYSKPSLEVTNFVINEMDKEFELEERKKRLSENEEKKAEEKAIAEKPALSLEEKK